MATNGKAVAATSIGILFVWSGIKGWSILGTIKDLITGVKPSGANVNPLGTNQAGTVGGASDAGSIAAIAQGYAGHAYSFGGAPGTDGAKPWDCSSFTNFVVGVRAGRPIPGYGPGKYDGSTHGPVTTQWGVWPGLTHIDKSQVQAGDIIVWTGHMGIAIDNANMISALSESDGTKITPIEGFGNGPLMCYGRLTPYIPYDKGAG